MLAKTCSIYYCSVIRCISPKLSQCLTEFLKLDWWNLKHEMLLRKFLIFDPDNILYCELNKETPFYISSLNFYVIELDNFRQMLAELNSNINCNFNLNFSFIFILSTTHPTHIRRSSLISSLSSTSTQTSITTSTKPLSLT